MTLLYASILLGGAAAGWVVWPILRRRLALIADPVPGGVVDAQARKRVALASLREVEYDRIAGKLDGEDYRELRARLESEAFLALRAAEGEAGGEERPAMHACGFANPAGSRYCSGCGAPLG